MRRGALALLWRAWMASLGLLAGCFSTGSEAKWKAAEGPVAESATGEYAEEGFASWYGGKFQGRQTANGEIFDTNMFTAAHKTLPFNTVVTVINLENNRQVQVRINDRGPFVAGRIIDLSLVAADSLGMLRQGTARVRVVADTLEMDKEQLMVVQLGSYSARVNAALLARKMQEAGLRPVVEFSKGFYRVVLHAVPLAQVEDLKRTLASLGVAAPLVRAS